MRIQGVSSRRSGKSAKSHLEDHRSTRSYVEVNVPKLVDDVLATVHKSFASLTHAVAQETISSLIQMGRKTLMEQDSMIEINPPVHVCGDIHGQFKDLLRIFSRIGWPPDKSYLFLGDYVDRGRHQLETIILVIAYKILYPQQFFILRGNHESAPINRVYGFYDEVKRRYSVSLWQEFQELFNVLPLTAVIGTRILCMHGGISPLIRGWEDFKVKRPLEVGEGGIVADLLWSDPSASAVGFDENSRGISCTFGVDAVTEFCDKLDIDLIARGHQVVQDGYEFFGNRRLVTIFSAPRYCGEFDNSAAVMFVSAELTIKFMIFKPTEVSRIRTDPNSSINFPPPRVPRRTPYPVSLNYPVSERSQPI